MSFFPSVQQWIWRIIPWGCRRRLRPQPRLRQGGGVFVRIDPMAAFVARAESVGPAADEHPRGAPDLRDTFREGEFSAQVARDLRLLRRRNGRQILPPIIGLSEERKSSLGFSLGALAIGCRRDLGGPWIYQRAADIAPSWNLPATAFGTAAASHRTPGPSMYPTRYHDRGPPEP
jgi:hypothetical protein